LGCGPLGGLYEPLADEQARATVEAALAAGITYFDTAPLYGYGLSERRLGLVLSTRPRRSVVISTKVGRLVAPRPDRAADDIFAGDAPGEARFDFTRDAVLRSLEQSLHRLRLDAVDVVFIHDPDDHYAAAVAEAYPALAELRDGGRVKAIGVGMNQHEMLSRFVEECDIDVVLCAGRYTLLDQSALGLLSRCVERRVSVVIGGAFNSGILANPSPGARYDYAPASDDVLARARRVRDVCRAHGVPLTAAALQFPASHPAVASVLIGVRSADQVRDNVAAFEQPVPLELWQELVEAGLLRADAPVPEAPA
jgi:D-threo-aldose 1-dehydrogenase